tara:strand:- start:1039 stop:1614 length:576 start_codon:yes stop_codon:yes gene_type:complete
MNDKLIIHIPESIADVTLGQYLEIQKLLERDLEDNAFTERLIILLSGISKRDVKKIDVRDYTMIGEAINVALNTDSEFSNRFTMKGVEYGMITNFDNITQGEYIDLTTSSEEGSNLATIMAVLFRPVIKSDSFDNYEIAPYDASTERIKAMENAPMSIVNGVMVFFWSLARELRVYTEKSIQDQVEVKSLQ